MKKGIYIYNNEYKNYFLNDDYLVVYLPDHPMASSKGTVRLHRLQAEKIVNRYLKQEEVVHHIDENKLNNELDNLMIFATRGDHTAFHNGYNKLICENNVYRIDREYYKNKINKINTESYNYKAKRPIEEELKRMIYNLPFTTIAKKYNVSDKAVEKWCTKYNIDYHYNSLKNNPEREKYKVEVIKPFIFE